MTTVPTWEVTNVLLRPPLTYADLNRPNSETKTSFLSPTRRLSSNNTRASAIQPNWLLSEVVIKPRPDQRKNTFYECLEVSGAESCFCSPMLKDLGNALFLGRLLRKIENWTRHNFVDAADCLSSAHDDLIRFSEGAIESARRKYDVDRPWIANACPGFPGMLETGPRVLLSRSPGSRKEAS